MARKTTATAAPRYVPNPRYEDAPYEIACTTASGHFLHCPWSHRYYSYEAAQRHLSTGIPQPESVPPMVKEGE